MSPEDIHVLHDIGPEEVNIIYRRCRPVYHDRSMGIGSQINGNTHSHPILSLPPKMAVVRSVPRLGSSWAPLRNIEVLKFLPNILMS